MARACCVSLLFLLLGRQDVDVLGVHSDLRGAVVEGVDLHYALPERRDVGRLCLVELLDEFLGLLVVEPADVLSCTLKRLVYGRELADGRRRDGATEHLARGGDAAQKCHVDSVGGARLECVVTLGVELAVRKRVRFDFAAVSASFAGLKFWVSMGSRNSENTWI